MKAYLDMCALKRPFDDQTQGRIMIETLAVTRILDAASNGSLTLCNSSALVAENRRNPNQKRRERVTILLQRIGPAHKVTPPVLSRAEEMVRLGITPMDALHLAFAENLNVDYLVTVDDDLLARCQRAKLTIKTIDPVELVKELNL